MIYGAFLGNQFDIILCIQSEYRKIRTRKTLYLDTFHAVNNLVMFLLVVSCCFQYFSTISIAKEKARLKLALSIPIGSSIIPKKEIVDIAPLAADKSIKTLSK